MVARFVLFSLLTLSLLSVSPVDAAGKRGRPLFLWKIQGKRNTVYLFGSIHVLGKNFYPLDATIVRAFQRSPVLVVEADVHRVDRSKIQRLTFRHGLYPPGKTLKTQLPPALYKEAAAYLKKRGLPITRFHRMKPWLLGTTLSMMVLRRLGFTGESGLDKTLLRLQAARIQRWKKTHAGRAVKKRSSAPSIQELEGMLFQLKIFSGFSPKVQEAILRSALQPPGDVRNKFLRMVKYWKSGADKKLETLAFADFQKAPKAFQDKMVLLRNRGMTRAILSYLKRPRDHFVAVGTAHLLGKDSILAMLRAKKIVVKRLRAAGVTKPLR